MRIVYLLFVPKFKFCDGIKTISNVRLIGYHRKRRGTENTLRLDSDTEIMSLMQNVRSLKKRQQPSKHEVLGKSDLFGHKQVEKTVGSHRVLEA